jgi:hypothetical protein
MNDRSGRPEWPLAGTCTAALKSRMTTLIYRDFDQAGLDRAYNNRQAVPDFQTLRGSLGR